MVYFRYQATVMSEAVPITCFVVGVVLATIGAGTIFFLHNGAASLLSPMAFAELGGGAIIELINTHAIT
jgi:hypothetical protein